MQNFPEIRQATPEDVSAIRACAEDAYQQFVEAIGRKPAPMVADFPSLIAQGCTHVAVDANDNVMGFVVFFPEGESILLENVAVHSDAVGKGVGKRLIAFCEQQARAITLYTNEKMTGNLSLYPHLAGC